MADPVDANAGSGGGSSKLMMGLLGLNMIVMVAVAAVLFLCQKKAAKEQTIDQLATENAPAWAAAPEAAPTADAAATQARFFSVGDFTANLAGPASSSYVKVTVNFEISQDADEEEMKQRKPQFRDKVISLLNSKKAVDLQSADGRNYLNIRSSKLSLEYFSNYL